MVQTNKQGNEKVFKQKHVHGHAGTKGIPSSFTNAQLRTKGIRSPGAKYYCAPTKKNCIVVKKTIGAKELN